MIIGIAGPMSLDILSQFLPKDVDLPVGYPFPMTSLLVTGLINRGYRVIAFTTSIGIDKPLIIKGQNLTLCIARREPHAARKLFYSERKDLVKLMSENKPDIINAHWTYEFAWAALATGIPTLVTVHDNAWTILKYQFDSYRIMRLIMNFIVLRKAKYLCINSKYLFELLPIHKKKFAKIIYDFYPTELEKYYELPKGKQNYIISVSNGFGRRKNIENGLKAFSLIKPKYGDLEYHLIGDGMEEYGPAYLFAKKNNLLAGVKFIGPKKFNTVKDEISNALLFLHPAQEESFGMVILESIVMGTPVVGGSNSGNVPYLLNNGRAGCLCDVNNPRLIAYEIEKLLSNDAYYNKLRKNAFEYSKSRFNEENIISDYIMYYKELIGK